MRNRLALAGIAAAIALPGAAAAHHSFAVFFDEEKIIEITGVVDSFEFRNPHGTIELTVEGEAGEEAWKAETNAPVILRRRGWSRDSLQPGDTIILTGWPARDGSNYLRMQSVRREDGSMVGQGLFAADDN